MDVLRRSAAGITLMAVYPGATGGPFQYAAFPLSHMVGHQVYQSLLWWTERGIINTRPLWVEDTLWPGAAPLGNGFPFDKPQPLSLCLPFTTYLHLDLCWSRHVLNHNQRWKNIWCRLPLEIRYLCYSINTIPSIWLLVLSEAKVKILKNLFEHTFPICYQ